MCFLFKRKKKKNTHLIFSEYIPKFDTYVVINFNDINNIEVSIDPEFKGDIVELKEYVIEIFKSLEE